MASKRVHGQIYDYMLRLRHFFGQQLVFGIVTTYNEWRVYWLPDCNDAAGKDVIGSPQSGASGSFPLSMPSISAKQIIEEDKEFARTPVKRHVYGTEVIFTVTP